MHDYSRKSYKFSEIIIYFEFPGKGNYVFKNNKVYLTEDVYISEAAYAELNRVREPSAFVTKMCYAILGYKRLAKYYIKDYKGNPYEEEFPGKVKRIISNYFDDFLYDHGYRGNPSMQEKSKINRYIGFALTYARKKLGLNKEKVVDKQKTRDN